RAIGGAGRTRPEFHRLVFLIDVDEQRSDPWRKTIPLERPVVVRPVRLLLERRGDAARERDREVVELLRRRLALDRFDVQLAAGRRPADLAELSFQPAEIELGDSRRRAYLER